MTIPRNTLWWIKHYHQGWIAVYANTQVDAIQLLKNRGYSDPKPIKDSELHDSQYANR